MSEVLTRGPAVEPDDKPKLQANAIGLIGLATLGAVMMSPALGIYGTWGPMAGIAGTPVPLIFLGALVISIPTAISYALVNREFPSSGSAFAWTWKTNSPAVATWVGLMMILYYTIAVILQPILFGLFFNALLTFMGVHGTGMGTWAIGVVIDTVLVLYLTYRGIQLSTRSAVIFITIEMLVVIALAITIAVTKVASGHFSVAPFNPTLIKGGLTGFWAAMILGILSYTGFDVISTVAEEARHPRRLLPIATLLCMVGVGVFWALTSWMLSIAVPLSEVARLNASGITAVTPIAAKYWGVGQIFVTLTGMTAATAVYVACSVGASRAIFAMARQGTLPARLGKLHPKFQVPWNAMHLVFGTSLIGVFVVSLILANPLTAYVWWAGPIVFFALITYIFVNLANIVYFARFARARFNWFLNGLVPVVGIGLDAYVIYNSFFVSLWGAGFKLGQSVIYLSMLFLLLGAGYVLYLKYRTPERLSGGLEAFREVEQVGSVV